MPEACFQHGAARPNERPLNVSFMQPLAEEQVGAALLWLSLAFVAPAFAQEAKPAVTPATSAAKPADPVKPQTTTSTQTTPAKPGDAAVVKTDVKKDEKKVDPKAATTPAGGTPKADAGKGDTTKTTEKPAETKKQ
jgi:hypothetical protein